ncbi:tetratricopeptide repeat protein [Hymenobacter artigasi]|uniref:Tetratricopeptide (TPR) repeat protein n=1 Tax=Hymenobacter artigasi TaxID=2719616 RepID=A0ABX1HG71_9BACT|nr:hypothetical protein [Hymenobacter artigasi]NKI89248.1 tetratricopeptide (TPR) repeat protein [Hymenobacter artigasi]
MKWHANFWMFVLLGSNMGAATAQVASDGNINLIPMYGGFKKSRALQKADARLLADFPDRRVAATQFAQRGWDFFYANDFTTAIKRFNQAWLLDSTNASAYWGFGVIEGQRQHPTDALRYFQISRRHNPANRRLLIDMAQALLSRYDVTHHSPDLDTAVAKLQEYLADTSDAKGTTDAYMKMAVAYFFKHDYSNAWKYVDSASALDATATHNWEFIPELQKASPR